MVEYNEKNYYLSNVPSNEDYIVQQAKIEIGGLLRLHYLGEELSLLGRFVRIAHFGLIGHPDLQIKVRTNLRSVFELCHDTVHTLHDFQHTSQEALESLQTAYRYLEKALEDQALKTLINLQEMPDKIKTQAGTLSIKHIEQLQFIQIVGDTTLERRSKVKKEQEDTIKKIEYLQVEKVAIDEGIKEAESAKQEAQTDLQSTYSKTEEAMDKLISASTENQKKYQEFMAEMHKKREALTSEYKKEIAKVDEDYTSSKGENQTAYLEQIKANNYKFKVSSAAITQEYEAALQENKSNLAKQLDSDSKTKKERADINAKDEKNKKLLKAEEDRQAANDNALKENNRSNKEAKSIKENITKRLEENYQDRLQQLDKEEESFKAGMKTILDAYETKIKDIKEKEYRIQKLIDESKENKKMAQKQMRKVVEQLTQCKSRAEIHKVTEESLNEAVHALNEIEAIMINVGNFWKEVEGMCESVTGHTMKKQVKMLSNMKPQERKVIWQSRAFKMDALNFYGKWIALKGVCATASGKVNSALDEVRQYMVENPNEDEAFKSIQEMAGKFLKELPYEESSLYCN